MRKGGSGRRGVIFSPPLVVALVNGKKTVTRRLGDAPPASPGDLLWVRESWALRDPARHAWRDALPGEVAYLATDPAPPGWRRRCARFLPMRLARLWFLVEDVRREPLHAIDDDDARREGLHATRLPLAGASGMTVWHVGDWPAGAVPKGPHGAPDGRLAFGRSPREGFAALWDSIHGDEAPWASNRDVWRVAFRPTAAPEE